MAFWSWSKTAATNATADATINWAEGMAPSAVNDSARAQMARTAEWRDDISGTITTGGTSTAYTATSNQVFDTLAHMNGAMIAFLPNATNTATVTLNVDGLGAKPLRSAPSVELPAGVLIQGTPYVVTYNNSDAAFYLQNFYSIPYTVPIGGLMPYVGTTAPNSNFVFPFGQAISRTTYATLFTLQGTPFGTGDGSTTFNLPDLRGRAVFGTDAMGGSTAGRITVAGGNWDGTARTTGGAENHTLSIAEMPSHNHGGSATPAVDNGSSSNIQYITPVAGSSGFAAGSSTIHNGSQMSVSIAAQGGGSAFTILPPAMTLPYILRVI